jgi:hypothetical protein
MNTFEDADFSILRSVKNTFIQFEIETPVPVISRRQSDISDARDRDSVAYKLEVESLLETSQNDSDGGGVADSEEDLVRSVVKNTFLEFEIETPVPVIFRIKSDISDSRDLNSRSYKLEAESLCQLSQTDSEDYDVADSDSGLFQLEETSSFSDTVNDSSRSNMESSTSWEACSDGESIRAVVRESVGSASHFEGLCRPCVWFWRANSCIKGNLCEYCHLCEEDVVKHSISQRQSLKNKRRKWKNVDRKYSA